MFEKIISKIGESLSKHKLPYMIIGGQAVLLYGEPRLTRDIDITLGINIDQTDKVLEIIKELSLKPIPKDIKSFINQTMVLPVLDEDSGIRVDFIFSFTPYESKAIQRARKIKINKKDVCFASPEDVIIHKIFAGRPRDLEDVKSILLKNPKMDFNYIKNWLECFEISSDKKDLLKIFNQLSIRS